MFSQQNIPYEMAEKAPGMSAGGIAAVHQLAHQIGLVKQINQALYLLKIHRPYHEWAQPVARTC